MERVQEPKCPLVLVVDDEPPMRMFVREASSNPGYAVCEAENGAQALERFAEHRPDIVLLDILMPGMDGFTVCSQLRDLAGGSRVPIMVMTDSTTPNRSPMPTNRARRTSSRNRSTR